MTAAPPRRRPPGRYDEPRASSRVLVVLAATVMGALVVAGIYALYSRSNEGRLAHSVRTYQVVSDSRVEITYEVRLGSDQRGECKLRARGRDGNDVGSAVVPVGPGEGAVLVVTSELATTGRASTGEVVACQVLAQP